MKVWANSTYLHLVFVLLLFCVCPLPQQLIYRLIFYLDQSLTTQALPGMVNIEGKCMFWFAVLAKAGLPFSFSFWLVMIHSLAGPRPWDPGRVECSVYSANTYSSSNLLQTEFVSSVLYSVNIYILKIF